MKIMEAHGLRVFDVEELKSMAARCACLRAETESQTHALHQNVQKVIGDEVKCEAWTRSRVTRASRGKSKRPSLSWSSF